MDNILDNLVPFAFYATVILVFYFTTKFQYQIKKEILARGGNIELAKRKFPFLEIALTIIGVGLGLGLSLLMCLQIPNLDMKSKNLIEGSFSLFFGGVGMVTGHLLSRRIDQTK